MLSRAITNVNSAWQSAQNAELAKKGRQFGHFKLGSRVKALNILIAAAVTRRHKLWRSQSPGKSKV